MKKNITGKELNVLIAKLADSSRDEHLKTLSVVIIKNYTITTHLIDIAFSQINKMDISILRITFENCVFEKKVSFKNKTAKLEQLGLTFAGCVFKRKLKFQPYRSELRPSVNLHDTEAPEIVIDGIPRIVLSNLTSPIVSIYRYDYQGKMSISLGRIYVRSLEMTNLEKYEGLSIGQCHEASVPILRNFFPILPISSVYCDQGSTLGSRPI
jgi:hypothetical protein